VIVDYRASRLQTRIHLLRDTLYLLHGVLRGVYSRRACEVGLTLSQALFVLCVGMLRVDFCVCLYVFCWAVALVCSWVLGSVLCMGSDITICYM
jgi:hypothetical protein